MNLTTYATPQVEIIEVEIEQGIAQSSNLPSFPTDPDPNEVEDL